MNRTAIAALTAAACLFPSLALACVSTTTPNTMAIVSPCIDQVVTVNQVTTPSPIGLPLSDAAMQTKRGMIPFDVQAPGMKNVEVWTSQSPESSASLAVRLTQSPTGDWVGQLNLTQALGGPKRIFVFAWDTLPGDNHYTVNLKGVFDLFISDGPKVVLPKPAGAAGLTLAWHDWFNDPVSVTACKTGSGIWPHCQLPTAADAEWYAFKPVPHSGSWYGIAPFTSPDEATGSPFSSFKSTEGAGFLRIRAKFDPTYMRNGVHYDWHTGQLASAFPDGSTRAVKGQGMGDGYYEIRAMVPFGYPNGGTWPAFWMLTTNFIKGQPGGDGEVDTFEAYGYGPKYLQFAEHAYTPATLDGIPGHGLLVYANNTTVDHTDDFHRYGMLVKNHQCTLYFDNVLTATHGCPILSGNTTPQQWVVMIDMAMGGGWPVNPPPANYYDLWIDYVEYFH